MTQNADSRLTEEQVQLEAKLAALLDWQNRLMECRHCKAVGPAPPRLRTLADGSTAVYRQCGHCRRAIGGAWPKERFRLDQLPRWDEELHGRSPGLGGG
jgi:hypothetical protein